ncbi:MULTISPECIES: short chain dehydrogenase [Aphanothece]|uniref:short chain dehydrogenase n=1 Tax=Aphanothece TaxID=1121 RepID=UPI003984F0F9
MRILLVGATGTIGKAILDVLQDRHEVVAVSRSSAPLHVDLGDPASIRSLFNQLGTLDAVVGAAGAARFKPFPLLKDEDYAFSLQNKLMGQVNLIRYGIPALSDAGSITVTTGLLAQQPMVGSAAVSLVNAALEGFVRAAALEAPRGIRINAVSPPWVRVADQSPGAPGMAGLSAHQVALAYRVLLEGDQTGQVVTP